MKYPISEIFGPTIQGEGPLIGTQSIFVRFAGCDSDCEWCDTSYAKKVLPETYQMSETEIQWEINTLADLASLKELTNRTYNVVLTGGNPCLYELRDLVYQLRSQPVEPWDIQRKITLETQGTIYKDWVAVCDSIIVSPKLDSRFKLLTLAEFCYHPQTSLKVVMTSIDDIIFVERLRTGFPYTPLIVQPCNFPDDDIETMIQRYLQVFEWVKHLPEVRVLPQLHRLLWGNQRGV